MSKMGFGPKSNNWESNIFKLYYIVVEPSLGSSENDSEEVLIRNTYLNGIQLKFNDNNFKKGSSTNSIL